jgi:hypothetical protein
MSRKSQLVSSLSKPAHVGHDSRRISLRSPRRLLSAFCAGELGLGSGKPHGRDFAHGNPEGTDRLSIGGAMDGALSLPMRIVDRGVERLDRGVEKTLN